LPSGISVIVPVFNSAEILPELVDRLHHVLQALGCPFEVILVDDASRDDSFRAMLAIAAERSWVQPIELTRNYGQHNAVLCGIRAARFDRIITMDDDLQHPPEVIPQLLAALDDDHDVVYGTPLRQQHGLWRDVASWITKLVLQHAMGSEVARNISSLRAIRTELREAFAAFQGPYVSIDVLLTYGTTRFGAVAVEHRRRHSGQSNYTFRKLMRHAVNMLTGFSTMPLRLVTVIGFGCMFLGCGQLAYVLGRYFLAGGSVPGFAFLASSLSIYSGAQLFAVGVLGEYLARIYSRSLDRPSYLVRRRPWASSSAKAADDSSRRAA